MFSVLAVMQGGGHPIPFFRRARRCIARVMSKTAPGDSRTLLSGMLDGIQYAIFTVRDVCSKEGGAWLR